MPESAPMIRVLVEDDSLAEFLARTLEVTRIGLASVDVIACGGWTGVFAHYDRLIKSGCNPKQIVPVFDADTIEQRPPRKRAVLDNPNLFRLSYDLESAFENWMLAEALLPWSPFGKERDPRNYLVCEGLVQRARSAGTRKGGLYKSLELCCREEYARQGCDPTTFVPPSKMELALAVAEIVCSVREFPPELDALVKHLEDIARITGLNLAPLHKARNPMTLCSDAIKAARLSGQVILSVSGQPYPHLWLADFDKLEICPIREMAYASWSPDGKLIAGMARMHTSPEYTRKSVLVIEASGIEKGWISTHAPIGSEGHPCWYPGGQSLVLRTDKGTFKVSCDAKRWKWLYEEAAFHCVSRTGRIARVRSSSLEIGSRGGNEPYQPVSDATDVCGAVSWSPSGRYIAFVNHISHDRGAVCIYNCRDHTTKFLTSYNGFPYFVCFSPDERSVLFTWRDRQGHSLRVVDIESYVVSVILDSAFELIVGCHAWRMPNAQNIESNYESNQAI